MRFSVMSLQISELLPKYQTGSSKNNLYNYPFGIGAMFAATSAANGHASTMIAFQ